MQPEFENSRNGQLKATALAGGNEPDDMVPLERRADDDVAGCHFVREH
jgi:hypothetical protein